MITALDAMTVVAKQLPDEGITMREFVTRSCKLRGDHESVIEEFLKLAEDDGFAADDIIKIGPCGSKLQ
mgnify:CR=1 FL=1